MKRREFLKLFLTSSFASGLGFITPFRPKKFDFYFAQLVYGKGLQWNPRPGVARSLAKILDQRTSIPASPERVEIRLSDSKLFFYPFLYFSGEDEFEPFSEKEIIRLRRWFDAGGFMLVDDALAEPGSGFDQSFQQELKRIFPEAKLTRLPSDHTVFQSYYLLDKVVGRKASVPYLSGITRGDLTVLIYSQNDMGGAIDRAGENYRYPVEPGGEAQREIAIRLFVNIILYALTANYKKDLIHIPFISERRKRTRR